jgi:hypothetical protein
LSLALFVAGDVLGAPGGEFGEFFPARLAGFYMKRSPAAIRITGLPSAAPAIQ